jgi:hypothetical protein
MTYRSDMKFHIYGRRKLEVRRENDGWEVYRQPETAGTADIFIPSVLETEDSATYLDDIYYELDGANYDNKLLS